jgi:hypothetical protein
VKYPVFRPYIFCASQQQHSLVILNAVVAG